MTEQEKIVENHLYKEKNGARLERQRLDDLVKETLYALKDTKDGKKLNGQIEKIVELTELLNSIYKISDGKIIIKNTRGFSRIYKMIFCYDEGTNDQTFINNLEKFSEELRNFEKIGAERLDNCILALTAYLER